MFWKNKELIDSLLSKMKQQDELINNQKQEIEKLKTRNADFKKQFTGIYNVEIARFNYTIPSIVAQHNPSVIDHVLRVMPQKFTEHLEIRFEHVQTELGYEIMATCPILKIKQRENDVC